MLFKKSRQKPLSLKWHCIGLMGKWFIDLLMGASRIEIRGREAVEPALASQRYIISFWHGRILLVSYVHKGWGAAILVSDSSDGEVIAQVLQRQGHVTVRGSTSKRGARAMAAMIKRMRADHRPGGVVPDGPKGPREKVQPGVIFLAQKTGYPIIPVTYGAKRRIVFNSWDRFVLPWPGTPCILIYGKPIRVPADSDAARTRECTQALENELRRITREADLHFGHTEYPIE